MKVTGLQVFWMILIMEVGMTLVMTLTPGVQAAKQDLWIAILVAGLITLLITFLVTNVTLLYPGQNLIELSQTILGKWLGKAVIVIYLVQWYTIIPIVLRQFADVINIMIMPETPKWAIMLIMILLFSYAAYSNGIVTISRCSEILGPIIILMVILVLLSSVNNIRLTNLLPVYADSGALNIIRGSLPSASYLGHSVEYLMLAAFLYQPRKGTPYAYWATIGSILVVTVALAMAIATIGINLTPTLWYPFFEMTRKISLFGFVENLDPLTIVTWVASVFIKLAVYMFITAYGTAQFLGIRKWRPLVIILAPIMLWFALIPRNVTEATTNYLMNYWVPFVLPVNMIGLPLLLLIVGKLRLRAQA
ncbi:GerAB/ArcD/ProY family transporter [Cohnella thailandensis]|uniref:Endospore germination permease n=1 Tax=Cohnella thailandensis TaxID=557557 RepID=A0A841SWP7_9BACL|nr:endospore germination permease [Cohnella thailandensis]MBB6633161.1 endospore germination permease [Cohnella thailandensis]MBP1975143.1 spore germination protein KB [Cohnella thailandensis]